MGYNTGIGGFYCAEARGIPTCAPSKVTAVLPMLMQALLSLSSVRVRCAGKKRKCRRCRFLLGLLEAVYALGKQSGGPLPQTLIDLFES